MLFFISTGKISKKSKERAASVESNCAITGSNDILHPSEDDSDVKGNTLNNIKQGDKTVQVKSWDRQAKKIDRYALVLMPLLFSMIATIYWSTYLCMG